MQKIEMVHIARRAHRIVTTHFSPKLPGEADGGFKNPREQPAALSFDPPETGGNTCFLSGFQFTYNITGKNGFQSTGEDKPALFKGLLDNICRIYLQFQKKKVY
ncbi:MAG: hypothetical protein L6W00_24200 [Lentisphaeria bacterium]|nr:MAG: hypothetical protein L6W00_24200 [Lentisphaeria bacterium]